MSRASAKEAYQAATAARRALESATVTSEEFEREYALACSTERAACEALVAAELAEPTHAEKRRANANLYWRNRGYD